MPHIAFTCLFCDDIRDELSGRFSYMGVYTDELVVSELPTIVPKFSICVIATVPIELMDVDGSIIVDMLGEEQPFPLIIAEKAKEHPDRDVAGIRVIMQISRNCFSISKVGEINVHFEENGSRRQIGALGINLAQE